MTITPTIPQTGCTLVKLDDTVANPMPPALDGDNANTGALLNVAKSATLTLHASIKADIIQAFSTEQFLCDDMITVTASHIHFAAQTAEEAAAHPSNCIFVGDIHYMETPVIASVEAFESDAV
jgi:hypothetical protein